MLEQCYGNYLDESTGVYHAFLVIKGKPLSSITGILIQDGVNRVLKMSKFTDDKGCRGRGFVRIPYPERIRIEDIRKIVPQIRNIQEYSLLEALRLIVNRRNPLYLSTLSSTK